MAKNALTSFFSNQDQSTPAGRKQSIYSILATCIIIELLTGESQQIAPNQLKIAFVSGRENRVAAWPAPELISGIMGLRLWVEVSSFGFSPPRASGGKIRTASPGSLVAGGFRLEMDVEPAGHPLPWIYGCA